MYSKLKLERGRIEMLVTVEEVYKEMKEDMQDNFMMRDMITGRKRMNLLNCKNVDKYQMDMLFNGWVYESVNNEGMM
jgi:hypothetical protein